MPRPLQQAAAFYLISEILSLTFTGFHLLALDALVDFFSVNSNFFGGTYADSDLISFDAQHSHRDVITNHQRLTNPPR